MRMSTIILTRNTRSMRTSTIILTQITRQHEEGAHAHHAPSRSSTSHLGHTHDDLNLKSAYLHVVADATTSILAIAALLGVRQFGAVWLDPMMGIVGAGLILRWSYLLLRDTSGILLDLAHGADATLVEHVKEHIEFRWGQQGQRPAPMEGGARAVCLCCFRRNRNGSNDRRIQA